MQAGFCGGEAANVSPAVGQLIKQAVTVIDSGGLPESQTGEGTLEAVLGTNLSVDDADIPFVLRYLRYPFESARV